MKFLTILTAFAATAVSAAPLQRRAIFSQTSFNDISISGGVAGGAAQAALNRLGPLPQDLTTVEQADIDFLNEVNNICNAAETDAFNPAIEAAEGDEKDALQRGKIQNKVLKLTATILKLQIQGAQGQDVAERLAEEETKLANNVGQDQDDAGLPATFVPFNAST